MSEATRALLSAAKAALRQKDYAQARQLARQLTERDPACEEGWLLLIGLSAPRASLAYARQAVALHPQSARLRRALVWAKKRQGMVAPTTPGRQGAHRRSRRWLLILVALLALLAVAWSVYWGAEVTQQEAAATPTLQPWVTVAATWRTATATLTATPSPTPTPTATATPTPRATLLPPALVVTATPTCRFVAELVDETIPDGTHLAAGETFHKTWTLKNAGTCAWAPSFSLVFARGDRMSGATQSRLGQEVLPGETITLGVDLAAPQDAGEYRGYWQLQTETGEPFGLAEGEAFWVQVVVGADANAQAVLPAEIGPNERWIDVDLSEQRLYAYEGRQLVNSFLVSTGTWQYPTVTGQYRIYVKYRYTDMAGPGYYLPNVPYTMYFYRGYGIHGTYWHNNFGTPMSHGCVNMRTDEAGWLFNWASVGTLVNIHP